MPWWRTSPMRSMGGNHSTARCGVGGRSTTTTRRRIAPGRAIFGTGHPGIRVYARGECARGGRVQDWRYRRSRHLAARREAAAARDPRPLQDRRVREPDRRLAGRQVHLAARLHGGAARPTPASSRSARTARSSKHDRQAAALHPRVSVPDHRPERSRRGLKIVWNFFYRTWYFGNLHAESQVNWVEPDGARAPHRRRT